MRDGIPGAPGTFWLVRVDDLVSDVYTFCSSRSVKIVPELEILLEEGGSCSPSRGFESIFPECGGLIVIFGVDTRPKVSVLRSSEEPVPVCPGEDAPIFDETKFLVSLETKSEILSDLVVVVGRSLGR